MHHPPLARRFPKHLLALLAVALLPLAFAGSAQGALSLNEVGFATDAPPLLNPDGTPRLKGDETFVDAPFVRQAGSHPDFVVDFNLTTDGNNFPTEPLKDVDIDLPVGMVGNPRAADLCKPKALAAKVASDCPITSQIGIVELRILGPAGDIQPSKVPLFNVAHGSEIPARFGFNYLGVVGTITARVRPDDYGISSGSFSISQGQSVLGARVIVWGVPADHSHDSLRSPGSFLGPPPNKPSDNYLCGTPAHASDPSCWGSPPNHEDPPSGTVCFADLPCELVSVDSRPLPFLSLPTSCTGQPLSFTLRADSWLVPGQFDSRTVSVDEDGNPFTLEGCERLGFEPAVNVSPLSRAADSPTGLDVVLTIPQSESPGGLATAHLRDVKMTFPQGMTVNASSAAGLGSCSPSEIGIGSNSAPTCPTSSRLGSVAIKTPLLEETLEGSVYLAKQNDNPFNSLLALYIAVKGPGFYLKLPGRIDPDPDTGQLTVSFKDNPQQPFETLHLELPAGPQAALTTPGRCGTYSVETELTPWSGTGTVKLSSPFEVNQGCATGGFSPGLQAGTVDPTGGAFSPFVMRITRADGEPNLSMIEATLPEGLLAKLGGVELCGDAQAATGDCPAASRVGKVVVGAGSGSNPLYVPEAGKAPTAAYLAGPYKGAPYSLVVKVPAQAGPFDLGTVTVRNALQVDPTTAQVTAKSDPLPQILQGIPIAYRDVRVEVNRPDFTINPTSCRAMAVTSTLTSATGQTATPSDGFQATGCRELGFGPSLKLSLKGKMNRTGNPAVKAVLKAPKGQANIAKTTVVLPKSEFIDNAHISNPCTRVQFNADQCPKGSILGHATAYTPLLDKPLSGPVYFRSNGGDRELPDLVADLDGQIHVTLVGFIDTAKSGGVRTRFANVPDAPVSKFVIRLSGGRKGLIENSKDLCSFVPKAKVQMTGQNGKTANSSLKLGTSCGKK